MSPIPAWDEYPIYLDEDEEDEEEDLEFDIFDLDIDYEV